MDPSRIEVLGAAEKAGALKPPKIDPRRTLHAGVTLPWGYRRDGGQVRCPDGVVIPVTWTPEPDRPLSPKVVQERLAFMRRMHDRYMSPAGERHRAWRRVRAARSLAQMACEARQEKPRAAPPREPRRRERSSSSSSSRSSSPATSSAPPDDGAPSGGPRSRGEWLASLVASGVVASDGRLKRDVYDRFERVWIRADAPPSRTRAGSVREIAKRTGFSRSTIARLRKAGQLDAILAGRGVA